MKKIINILFLGIIFLVIFGCDKDYEEDETFPNGSDFKIVNAAPNLGLPLVIYFDDNKLVDQNLYNSATSYYRVSNASHNISFNSLSQDEEENIFNISDNFELNKNVTYFLYNPSVSSTELEYIKVYDDVTAPDYNVSKIRLANFSYDLTTNVDVIAGGTVSSSTSIITGGTVVISDVSPKQVTEFTSITSGLALHVVKTGTTKRLVTITATNIKSKGVYTLLFTGYESVTPSLSFTAYSNSQ